VEIFCDVGDNSLLALYNPGNRLTPTKRMKSYRNTLCASLLVVAFLTTATAQRSRQNTAVSAVSTDILLRIIRAEDERRWDDNLRALLTAKDARVRKRAALAAGRIGDERAVPALVELVQKDPDNDVCQMATFALGEIESPAGADALTAAVRTGSGSDRVDSVTHARAVEALGKIAAALLESEKDRKAAYGAAILDALKFETGRRSMPDRLTILLGLTAALRAKPDGAGAVIKRFLGYSDSRIVADALNAMARLRLKDGNDETRSLLVKHSDPIVRANAARVLGATEDKDAFDALLDRALHDDDLRVRVSAIRALGSLKDKRAVQPLLEHGNSLLSGRQHINELLEITATLGRLLPNSADEKVLTFLRTMQRITKGEATEVEIAFARFAPGIFQNDPYEAEILGRHVSARRVRSVAQGLGAIKEVITGAAAGSAGDSALKLAEKELRDMLHHPGTPTLAIPDVLQAYGVYKPADLGEISRDYLRASDVIVRATAAELLGNLPDETNTRALIEALPIALKDKDLNDAALAILDALAKQKNAAADEAIKSALDSSDHLIRRKAVALLKANGVGDFSDRIGNVKTRYTDADYRRAIARIGKHVTATVVTSKGSFVIEFLTEEAPLTVDNFISLAREGFFNGQTIPRVVPNFVVQAGDPRGDQNGGPGYQIRCEINEVPYERAAVGMALSGKDTGGSQWFVTHSPQPHLDGGYTVFGRVISGMEVVDNVARGDTIRRVTIIER
jgi:cyclophilin family peptidyl-prolyl cis-trans isomerase/HEAT repeat protein